MVLPAQRHDCHTYPNLSGEAQNVDVNRNVLVAGCCFEGSMRAIQPTLGMVSRKRGAGDE